MVGGLTKIETCPPKAVMHGVGTAVPKFFKYQKDILELMLQHNGFNEASSETKKRNDFIRAVYAGSKIEKRHVANPKYGERAESIKQAMEMYADAGLPLALEGPCPEYFCTPDFWAHHAKNIFSLFIFHDYPD